MAHEGGLVNRETIVKGKHEDTDKADILFLQNGNYPDPSLTSALPVKRQFRDPYADW